MFSEKTLESMKADIGVAFPHTIQAGPAAPLPWAKIFAAIEAIIQGLIPIFSQPSP